MNPGQKARILSICDDDALRSSRELILRHDGYDVVSANSIHASNTARRGEFDIVILCHSADSQLTRQAVGFLRERNPEIRILRVNAARPELDGHPDLTCNSLDGPLALLSAIKKLSNWKAEERV
jgi:CheY-like chemotaxis protein